MKHVRATKFISLLNSTDEYNQTVLVGELRAIQKIMTVLELSAEPFDISAGNSNED